MKPCSRRIPSQAFALWAAPILTFSSASGEVLVFNEANASNIWQIPPGTNLLNGATATPSNPATHEGSSPSWTVVTDGVLGAPGDNAATVTPNNGEEVIFPLDIAAQPDGYDITSFDSWVVWANSGRSNQNYVLQYSTVEEPTVFNTIATVANADAATNLSTHTNITDTTGVLASGVHSVKLIFNNQENGYVGFSELKLLATPTNVQTLVEANTGNEWTLPSGANLLKGEMANPPSTNTNEGSSPNWTTVTDGSLGTAADISSSVTPPNMDSVIFPLDTSVNFNGYNLTSFDSYCAWPNSGRDNQDFRISYSTVADPDTFIFLGTAVAHTSSENATHVRLTAATGFLATGVAAIKLDFGHQENGFVGYREFIALGSAVSLSDPLTWTGNSGTGGNANWITGADSNWKKTAGGAAANYNPQAPLTFDNNSTNRNITVSSALASASMAFTNDAAHPFTFGGQKVTVSNDISSSGAGTATFNNALQAGTGVAVTGAGSLVFNEALSGTGVTVSGSGNLTLNAANPELAGNATVSNGTLTVSHDGGLQGGKLVATGGSVRFTSAAPQVATISGTAEGSIVLGKTSGPLVNTNLSAGDAASVTTFAGNISQASGTTGRLTKAGGSTLILSGTNSYSGPTSVAGGVLQLERRLSLYNGNSASWTASNLLVSAGGTLSLRAGFFDEFTEEEINSLALGGFQSGSTLGIKNIDNIVLSRNLTQPGVGLLKTGTGLLTITGNNSSDGTVRIAEGSVHAASEGGTAIPGNVLLGSAVTDVFLSFGADNQFGPGTVVSAANGSFYQTKINLRGTNQTVAGLDVAPFPANRVTLFQNDENTLPDYAGEPLPATLTINATTDHSFAGLIRNGDGGNTVSVVKNGAGIQEFRNLSGVQGYGYTGPTSLNEGTLKLAFGGGNFEFASDITVAEPATLHFNAVTGNWVFNRVISGPGKVFVDGVNAVVLNNGASNWTGGTVVEGGFLALAGNGATGQGTGPGEGCVGGAMDPANVIEINAGTLSLDGIAPLGNSGMLPEFAPTIHINEGSKLYGGTNTVAFVPNLTLDGGEIEITNGAGHGGFNTDLALVGTVIVGGSSAIPAEIYTTGTGPYANISLGSLGVPGTVFDVADVSNDSFADLTVSSVLRNVSSVASPLTKTGPGTMQLSGVNSYTGTTRVEEGVLQLDMPYLALGSTVEIETAGTLSLQFSGEDTVAGLKLAGASMPDGTYAAVGNGGPGITETPRLTGIGRLVVSSSGVQSYESWAAVIPDETQRDRTADPDGDGFSNLEEYLFGTSPTSADGALTHLENGDSGLVLRWNELTGGNGTYVLQESTTLVDPWGTSGLTPIDAAVQDLPGYVRKEALVPVDVARKFIRVQGAE
ncbi:beta strand repeat-containing protein [Luteolibacter luteus]|uniref:Autotransporter-associated beta strand repeat protein n=1 Tax=Luteolibacter luteus TaxID=2728835 RepID=A0A858RPA9_9BACT|nr:autotransporter-associated beta strand repeat-containing protein [Luteolibacter luteus]QJE98354.1 hypothetical protein HHL09_22065 [Luteolibacter luteus]